MPTANKTFGPALALAVLATAFSAASAQQTTQQTGIKLSGKEPISIESDKLEVKDAEHLANFTGNVTVVQGEMLMKSGSMVVHYAQGAMKAPGGLAGEGASGIEKIDVADKVYLKSKTQVATGDNGIFEMATEVFVLTGAQVVLTDADGNVITGCKLTVQMKTGAAKFDPCPGKRVGMLLKPNQSTAPAGGAATGAAK